MPTGGDIFILFYLGMMAWFFFWLSPRVNDGRLEEMIEKFIASREAKEKEKKDE